MAAGARESEVFWPAYSAWHPWRLNDDFPRCRGEEEMLKALRVLYCLSLSFFISAFLFRLLCIFFAGS
jgi:hypothetical protein